GLGLVDLVGASKRRDRGVGVPRLPRRRGGVEDRHPRLAPVEGDVVFAARRKRQSLREGGVRAREIVDRLVIPRQVVPRARAFSVVVCPDGLRQVALCFLERLGALVRELRVRPGPERFHATVHPAARLEPTCRRRRDETDTLRAQGGRSRSGHTHAPEKGDLMLHGHAHSLDLATNASASRCATRATSSGGRPSTRAAARTSSYFGFRCPAPHPLFSMRHCPGGGPAARTRTKAAPVGVVASPSTGPPVASSTPSSRIAVAGAGTGSRPCSASTHPFPTATGQAYTASTSSCSNPSIAPTMSSTASTAPTSCRCTVSGATPCTRPSASPTSWNARTARSF